jgi:CspA family cold shock protein
MRRGVSPSQVRQIMPTGILVRYRESGGFGFIQPDEDGADTFVHCSKLRIAGIEFPRDGMRLQFDIKKHSGAKVQATNIELIGE